MKNFLTPFSRFDSMIDEFFNDRISLFDKGFNTRSGSYNIIKKSDEVYQIVLNIAGFKKEDIDMTVEGDMLIIKGSIKQEQNKDKYIYQGFSSTFYNSFLIGKDAEILNAEVKDGMLVIDVKDHKQVTNQAKRIAIK